MIPTKIAVLGVKNRREWVRILLTMTTCCETVFKKTGLTSRHDFIDFLFTEHLLTCFLLAGKIIDSKKVWFKYTPKIHTKNGWLKWLYTKIG
jgi:hypothetical protein